MYDLMLVEKGKKEKTGSHSLDTDSPAMVSGNSCYNYSHNSSFQRKFVGVVKPKIDELIAKKLDLYGMMRASCNTFRIADLGCAVGPNTFFNVQDVIQQVNHKSHMSDHPTPPPEFQVFFNDQIDNDFNALFRSLPTGRVYFAAGVPGSFHGRLFPSSSIHFAHCAMSLHWISRVPREVLNRESPAWNRGRIHCSGAPQQVVDAYRAQFEKNMEGFLKARAQELVSGGILVIVIGGVPEETPYSEMQSSFMFDCINLSILDLVGQGVVSEDQLDSFNLPLYNPRPTEMRELVERNGCFSIEEFELTTSVSARLQGKVDVRQWVGVMRGVLDELFVRHFGREFADIIFDGTIDKITERAHVLESKLDEKNLLYIALTLK